MMISLRTLTAFVLVAVAFSGCVQNDESGDGGTNAPSGSTTPPRSAHEQRVADLWLCQGENAVEVDDTNTTTRGGLTCRNALAFSNGNVIVSASGIPNHDLESGPGCCASEQTYSWTLPVIPVNDTDGEFERAPLRGPVGVAVNGVPIYGPEDGPGGDAVAAQAGAYAESRQPIWLGICHAHSGPGGAYHYHADANCIHWNPGEGEAFLDYTFAKVDATRHSSVIGFAFDGYPIYGSHGFDASGAVKEMTSSYRLAEGKDGSGGVGDYAYVEGLGDLDACNGKWSATPEFPEGTYAYYSTRVNGEGGIGFPYFLMCYRGIADMTNVMAAGGAPPGGPGGPRP